MKDTPVVRDLSVTGEDAHVPVRLQPADPALVGPALARFRAGDADRDDLRLLTKHLLALLVAKAPGGAVEVRIPPYAAAQCLQGTRHTRGTPPATVEMDATTWIALGVGDLDWAEAAQDARLSASGERSDLSALLPLTTG
ncbi:MAG: sterol carrier family protein [Nocardioidaceae bacterium]